MRPGDARCQFDTREHVRISRRGANPVTPGIGGDETIVAGTSKDRCRRTENRITAVGHFCDRRQVGNANPCNFTDQGHALGAQALVPEIQRRGLRLGDVEAVVAGSIGAGVRIERPALRQVITPGGAGARPVLPVGLNLDGFGKSAGGALGNDNAQHAGQLR